MMKRKMISAVLALMMVLSLLPMAAMAADNVTLDITVRDFKADGLLFEGRINSGTGLVASTLGSDKKPVYNLSMWKEMYGQEVTQSMLDAFFNDVTGVNMKAQKTLMMFPEGNGYYVIDSSKDAAGNSLDGFFPIDNELFGNEDNKHNYHFSVEIHTKFKYVQGATFEFKGDDDVWVYFNNKLVIDLGGVHGASRKTVNVDEIAADLGIKPGDIVSFDMFYMERHLSGSNMYIRTNFEFLNLQASEWATKELQKADELGLIPDALKTADLTKNITRAEFAAVAVKVFENLAGTKALPATVNPFKDTSDVEVLKAYNTGLMVGVSADKFEPSTLLNREQAATALTRVFKRATIPGWTFATDGNYTLNFTLPAKFADDGSISDWAKPSVYFMVTNDIIKGVGDNKFSPRAITTAEQAQGYASATREQALVIAVRMVENLGGKTADYTAK